MVEHFEGVDVVEARAVAAVGIVRVVLLRARGGVDPIDAFRKREGKRGGSSPGRGCNLEHPV